MHVLKSYRGSNPEESHLLGIFGNRRMQIPWKMSRGLGVSKSRGEDLPTVVQASLPVLLPRGHCGAASLHDKSAFVLWNRHSRPRGSNEPRNCGAASLHDKSAFVLWNKAQQALKTSRQ